MKKFNVGDIVKIKKSVHCPFTVGGAWKKDKRLGVVIYRDKEPYPYIVFSLQGDRTDTHTWVYGAEDLKLVSPIQDSFQKAYGNPNGT